MGYYSRKYERELEAMGAETPWLVAAVKLLVPIQKRAKVMAFFTGVNVARWHDYFYRF